MSSKGAWFKNYRVAIVTAAGPAVAAVLSYLVAQVSGWFIIPAVLVVLGTGVVTVLDKVRREAAIRDVPTVEQDARLKLTHAINDALDPTVEALGELISAERRHRRVLKGTTITGILHCAAHLIGPDRTRVCWYRLQDDRRTLAFQSHAGRAGAAKTTFKEGTERGDAALHLVHEGDAIVCPDITIDPPPGFTSDLPHDYGCFISVPVRTGGTAYGMLTCDAPNANELTDVDEKLLRLLARLLAVAAAVKVT